MKMRREIRVYYSAVDGFRKCGVFQTIGGARKFAARYVGKDAEIGFPYAVATDGVGKVEVVGASLRELFST